MSSSHAYGDPMATDVNGCCCDGTCTAAPTWPVPESASTASPAAHAVQFPFSPARPFSFVSSRTDTSPSVSSCRRRAVASPRTIAILAHRLQRVWLTRWAVPPGRSSTVGPHLLSLARGPSMTAFPLLLTTGQPMPTPTRPTCTCPLARQPARRANSAYKKERRVSPAFLPSARARLSSRSRLLHVCAAPASRVCSAPWPTRAST